MNKRRISFLIVVIIVGFAAVVFLFNKNSGGYPAKEIKTPIPVVLTSLPSTFSLVKALTLNTTIRTINVLPAHMGMHRHAGYFKQNQAKMTKLFNTASAVVSIRHAWLQDPLYPAARSKNIRIIEIDSISPLHQVGSGVALQNVSGILAEKGVSSVSPMTWLSLTHYLKSIDIVADDLILMFQDQAQRIETNRHQFKRRVFQLKTNYENRFIELDNLEVVAMTNNFIYFTESLGIDVIDYFLKPEIRWSDADVKSLYRTLIENEIRVVIHKWEPEKRILQAISAAGSCLVVLSQIDSWEGNGNIPDPDDFLKQMEKNYKLMLNGLNAEVE